MGGWYKVTTEEAEIKWCPFVKCGGVNDDGISDSGLIGTL